MQRAGRGRPRVRCGAQGESTQTLLDCNVCHFPRRLPFLRTVNLREQQVSNRLFADGRSHDPSKLPHARLLCPRGGGSFLHRVRSTGDALPRPHLADLQDLTVSGGRPRRKLERNRAQGSASGAPFLSQRCSSLSPKMWGSRKAWYHWICWRDWGLSPRVLGA